MLFLLLIVLAILAILPAAMRGLWWLAKGVFIIGAILWIIHPFIGQ